MNKNECKELLKEATNGENLTTNTSGPDNISQLRSNCTFSPVVHLCEELIPSDSKIVFLAL